MKVIEKTIQFEDFNYVEGILELKLAGDKLFESNLSEQFNVSDVLAAKLFIDKKYIAPQIPQGIDKNRIFTIDLPLEIPSVVKQGNKEIYFNAQYDEVVCDDSNVSQDGYLIIKRYNTIKEGNKVYSTVRLKVYGLKKSYREETQQQTFYEIFTDVEGNGSIQIEPKKEYYAAGEKVRISAIPDKYGNFLGWEKDFSGVSEQTVEVTIKEDINVKANFDFKEEIKHPSDWWQQPASNRIKDQAVGCWETLGEVFSALVAIFIVFIVALALISIFGWYVLLIIGIGLLFWIIPQLLRIVLSFRVLRVLSNFFLFFLIGYALLAFLSEFRFQDLSVRPIDPLPEVNKIENENNSIDYVHYIHWTDYDDVNYGAYLKVNSDQVNYESRVKESISIIDDEGDYNYLLKRMSMIGEESTFFVTESIDSLIATNNISREKLPEVLVSMIQQIPYYAIVQQSCNPYAYNDIAIQELLLQKPCQGYVRHGIKSSAEFLKDLKGDCDSRTLFLYTLLKQYGYDVAIFGSLHYQHSLLGIAGLNNQQKGVYKMVNGVRYSLWETTAFGFNAGDISPEINNMAYWQLNIN